MAQAFDYLVMRPTRPWLPYLLVGLAAVLAHGLSLKAEFYMDDKPHILMNDRIQEDLDAPSGFKSRHLTYAIWRGLHLAFGSDPVAYHAVNLLLHVGVVLLFLPVARRFLEWNPALSEQRRGTVAFWGTLLFAVHPLVSEPINYAAQTSILLVTLFSTAACLAFQGWHRSRRPGLLVLTVLAVGLAAHSKEPGTFHALIPLIFMGAVLINVKKLWEGMFTSTRRRLAMLLTGGALAIVFVASWMINAWMRLSDFERFTHHALTQSRVLFSYLWRVVYPAGLSSDHHIPWTTSWADWPAVAGLLLTIAGGAILLYLVARRRSWTAALLGMGLFHLLIRFAYPVDELMVEYRLYPAMPWFGLALALGVTRLLALKPGGLFTRWEPAVFGLLALLGIAVSADRSRDWHDENRLAVDVIQRYPHNLRAWSIHFSHLAARGQYEQLIKLRDLPRQVAVETGRAPGSRAVRAFSGEKIYTNYVTCQYPVIMALLHTGQSAEALRRADILFVDVLTKVPCKNHISLFTAALAKLVCHTVRGELARVEETLAIARAHYDDVTYLRHHLAEQAATLPAQVAVSDLPEEL